MHHFSLIAHYLSSYLIIRGYSDAIKLSVDRYQNLLLVEVHIFKASEKNPEKEVKVLRKRRRRLSFEEVVVVALSDDVRVFSLCSFFKNPFLSLSLERRLAI